MRVSQPTSAIGVALLAPGWLYTLAVGYISVHTRCITRAWKYALQDRTGYSDSAVIMGRNWLI